MSRLLQLRESELAELAGGGVVVSQEAAPSPSWGGDVGRGMSAGNGGAAPSSSASSVRRDASNQERVRAADNNHGIKGCCHLIFCCAYVWHFA